MAMASRVWHGLLAALVAFALGAQLWLVLDADDSVWNLFSYFTIQSNILVLLTSITLALDPNHDGRVWRVLRLDALVCISVTGIVYALVLAPLEDFTGLRAVCNTLFHYVSPVMAFGGWCFFGPRPRIGPKTVRLSLIFPVGWLVYTLIRGPFVDWYPYPFIDVADLGYGQVAVNCLGVTAIFLMLAGIFKWIDQRSPGGRPNEEPALEVGHTH